LLGPWGPWIDTAGVLADTAETPAGLPADTAEVPAGLPAALPVPAGTRPVSSACRLWFSVIVDLQFVAAAPGRAEAPGAAPALFPSSTLATPHHLL
jgi:hypothetical protein